MKGRNKLSVFKMERAAECGMKAEATACAGIIKWLRIS